MLITVPIGALVSSVVFDIVHLATGNAVWASAAFWTMAIGIIGALVAAIPGFVDWWRIPRATRAKQVGVTHMLVQLLGTTIFIINWLMRYHAAESAGVGLFILSVFALILISIGGWLGGELVERLGIGVWEDAQPDAPSSLHRERRVPGGFRPTEPRPI